MNAKSTTYKARLLTTLFSFILFATSRNVGEENIFERDKRRIQTPFNKEKKEKQTRSNQIMKFKQVCQ